MAQINFRIDDDLKSRADALFNELGLNMTTACIIFIRQAVRQGSIPFEITTKPDLFYSASNMRALQKSIQQAEEGKFVVKTMDELLAMEK
ncbi:MAG: type II toxin-antitoxin system RelB/DinJ family antitoxin [Syntrophomonadaceae bacterium]|nr:type II toxin-antitoxin system RelB/DinJ family antitoxin [Syntrophomonadaceae bacterium]